MPSSKVVGAAAGEASFQTLTVPGALEGEKEDSFAETKALQMSTHGKLRKKTVSNSTCILWAQLRRRTIVLIVPTMGMAAPNTRGSPQGHMGPV